MDPGDHTLRRFFEHTLAALTNADGKIFLTVRLLLTRPGQLTADYLRGKRKLYIAPVQIFLIANLIFFLLHPIIGSDTLTTDLHTQLSDTWHNAIARGLVKSRLAARGISSEGYAAAFDAAAITRAKSLVILVAPIFSLAVMALYWRRRRLYTAHLVFALHFCAFWLLLISGTLALNNLTVRLLRTVRIFPSATAVSQGVILFSLAIMTVYLFRAVRRVFTGESLLVSGVKALTLGIAFDLSLQAYRLVLFFITFWST